MQGKELERKEAAISVPLPSTRRTLSLYSYRREMRFSSAFGFWLLRFIVCFLLLSFIFYLWSSCFFAFCFILLAFCFWLLAWLFGFCFLLSALWKLFHQLHSHPQMPLRQPQPKRKKSRWIELMILSLLTFCMFPWPKTRSDRGNENLGGTTDVWGNNENFWGISLVPFNAFF